MDDSVYDRLPADPEQAFVLLELHFREERDEAIQRAGQDERLDVHYVAYIAQVLAAVSALGLEPEFRGEVPLVEDTDYSTYLNFNKDVTHYLTQLKIRQGRRNAGASVQLDAAAREKIGHFVSQIKDIIQNLEVDDRRREAIIKKLFDFELEVSRSRSRYDAFASLVIETAGVAGQAAERLEPVRRLLDSIAGVIWGAKQKEDEAKQLPPAAERKRLEPPRVQKKPAPGPFSDDDIPF
jgi:hypothetical protein